jgi:hypothetical protein
VWANANFKNNVILGSNSSDDISVSGTLRNFGGASLTGSFSGSGQNLNNIPNGGLQNYEINLNGSNIALGGTGSVGILREIIGSSNITIGLTNATTRSVSLKDDISLNSVTASFSGNGQNLNNLTASNFNDFAGDVRKQIYGTSPINYNQSTGEITYVGAGGTIYTDGNITGSGTSIDPLRTKENITGSSFTASVGISSSYFYGDGSNLTNLPIPLIDLSQYATLTGVSSSFTTLTQVSGAITGALNPYALSSDVSSSFGSKIDLTASYAQLNTNNTFTGVNTFDAFTGSSAFISGDVRINGTASVGALNTVNQTSLQIGDKYIIILSGAIDHPSLDGSGVLWGSGSVGDPTQGPLGEMAYVRYYAANDQIEIFPGLKVSGSLTASAPSSFTEITASTGFKGRLYDTASYALDADTLDGLHASSFAQQNTTVTFTQITASTALSSSGHAAFGGGVKIAYAAKTSNYTLTASSDYVISMSGSNLTGTLPNAANTLGTVLVIKNLHTSSIFVTSSVARIDGSAVGVYINGQYTSYTFLSDNTNWLII